MADPDDDDADFLVPSSPPLLDHDNVPSSPLPCEISTFSARLPARKRQLSHFDNSLSSDPLFSEEPSEADDVTRYEGPRKKRMERGPWWKTSHEKAGHKDEAATRNFDSGVFMGSDLSDGSIEMALPEYPTTSDLAVDERPSRAVREPVMNRGGEQRASTVINRCLETGIEVIDLSHLALTVLSSATLKPLHQLIRQSHNHHTEPPSEDEFTVFTPDIQLFLAGNDLTSLPDELFCLRNVTVLSVRNNQLAELPTYVSRLTRLRELNIAGNNIRYLPWELFQFFENRDSKIIVRPNPFLEPVDFSEQGQPRTTLALTPALHASLAHAPSHETILDSLRQQSFKIGSPDAVSELELRLMAGRIWQERYRAEDSGVLRREELLYLASSAIYYFGVDGRPRSRRPDGEESYAAVLALLDDQTESTTSPPSLFELAVRSAQTHYHLNDLPDGMPVAVKAAMQKAAQNTRLGGNQTCSTCARPFVIARARWIEYWFNGMSSQTTLTRETILPFMKVACGWQCAVPTRLGDSRC